MLSVLGWVIDLIIPGKMPYGWLGGYRGSYVGGTLGGWLSRALAFGNFQRLHALVCNRTIGRYTLAGSCVLMGMSGRRTNCKIGELWLVRVTSKVTTA